LSKILGIIGGGQLGMMLTETAKKMPEYISKVIVLDPNKNCPAAKVGAKQIIGNFSDKNAIVELSMQSDIITYEIESGDSETLQTIRGPITINPSPATLRIIQDKYLQKKFLRENKIPVTDFTSITSIAELQQRIASFGYPVMLKLRRNAYDGRGNYKIYTPAQITKGYSEFDSKSLFLEKYVNFLCEISVIAARNTIGEIAIYPPVENIHEENILRMSIAPARISKKVSKDAEQIARKVMNAFQGAGVFGIEMFVTKDEQVLVNEIAPRVHNSGHHTLQSSTTSQFEQHLRAILGLKLGKTDLLHYTIMCNILGPKDLRGRCKAVNVRPLDGIYVKWYQKDEIKPLRKMGHFNVVDINDSRDINALISKADEARKSMSFLMEN
jgi:5-(carboxyamino)imidazole ribonucleotide synthase